MSGKNQYNKRRIRVLLPLPLGGAYDYAWEGDSPVPPEGSFLRVPLGRRGMTGVLWKTGDLSADTVPDERLKPAGEVFELPPLSTENRRFVDWVASYTLFPPGAVLKMMMSVDDVFEGVGETFGYVALNTVSPLSSVRMTEARRKVLAAVSDVPRSAAEIARRAGVSAGVVTGLADAGLLSRAPVEACRFHTPDPEHPGVDLSPEQKAAAAALKSAVENGFSVTVLNGVTGSGKTEVYFEMIAETLRQGKQALVLLPEIGLTGQWLDRFRRRFGTEPALWHSDLSAKKRRETWKAVLNGEIRVLAGARSALFLPFPDLGLVIVDEEHDSSYKQEEGVIYHARDMAVVRGMMSGAPVLLSSATPSLETIVNIRNGRYREVLLPSRFGAARMPSVRLVDLRKNPPQDMNGLKSFLSPVLLEEISGALTRGEQTLLFLNRRGYAPLVVCRKCGHRFQCTRCSAWLVEHRNGRRLECHHCGYSLPVPEVCPVCGAADELTSCGPGVERIDEEIRIRFPEARRLTVTSDLNASPHLLHEAVRQIRDREADIVIGTQILAKGHHFPGLTLVGVVDADLGLSGGDLRAGERTFQMLHQVAGRAGRAEKEGFVYLQTYDTENRVIHALASGETEAFLEAETEARALLHMPPFGRMAALVVSSAKRERAEQGAAHLGRCAPYGPGIRVLGPAPAPLALLRGRYRYRLLLQTQKDVRIQDILQHWMKAAGMPRDIRVQIDIDPYSFF